MQFDVAMSPCGLAKALDTEKIFKFTGWTDSWVTWSCNARWEGGESWEGLEGLGRLIGEQSKKLESSGSRVKRFVGFKSYPF